MRSSILLYILFLSTVHIRKYISAFKAPVRNSLLMLSPLVNLLQVRKVEEGTMDILFCQIAFAHLENNTVGRPTITSGFSNPIL